MTVAFLPIGTKADVPRLPEPWIRRARLNDACSRVGPGEALLVAAFAGSGKTTLLTDWFTNDCDARQRAWLTLDARDNAPGRLGRLLVRAFGFDDAFDDLDRRRHADTVVLDRIFEHLEARSEQTVLVLDDVHELTSRHAMATLSHLLLSLPADLSVVLAARADPPLPFTRLQFERRLHQIRTSDLALTHAEAAQMLASHGVPLDAGDVEALRVRTGGWAGGMRLAALALENVDPESFVEKVVRTDTLISDYLLHEVLESQPAETRKFLLRTGVVSVLTEELARELSGNADAGARLAELERSGLFAAQGVDSTRTYRVHALFGDLLRARLRHDEPELARSLLIRAARWYDAHDMPVEAERHAYESGDLQLAGTLSCRRFVYAALTGTWTESAGMAVPAADAADMPELALIAAANAIVELDRRSADLWRNRLDALWVSVEPTVPAGAQGWFAVARLLLDVFYGRAFGTDDRSLLSCRALLGVDIGSYTSSLHTVARLREAELLLGTENDDAPRRALLDARWHAGRNAAPWVVDECDTLLALIAAVDGRLESCDALLQGIPTRNALDPISDTRRLAHTLCDAQRGRNHSARTALLAEPSRFATHAVQGGIRTAIELLDNDARPDRDPRPFAMPVHIALGVIEGRGMAPPEAAVAAARGLLAGHHDREVLQLLGPIASDAGKADNVRTRIEALTLAAIAADRLDDHARALELVQAGLDLAAPGDLRAPFLAHAAGFGDLVNRYSWQLNGSNGYAAALIDDLRPAEPPVFVEPLTARERAVLEYLPTMMTNTEIAGQLLVSVNTVKTHLKSVYRKLGVERRRDAVVRAKQLEILSSAVQAIGSSDSMRRTSTSSSPSASMRRSNP